MRLVITGAHFSPALSVIKKLPKETEVLYIGRRHALEGDSAVALEYQTLRKLKIPFESITTGRFQRKMSPASLTSFLKLPKGFGQSLAILSKYKPDGVLSFGGYISLPVVVSAYLLNIPVVIHEQTLEAGLANRIAGLFAGKICISFETSRPFFPSSKVVLTGNPVRPEFSTSPRLRGASGIKSSVPIIYITGGSLGSHPINVLVEGCVSQLLEHYTVIHQTGDAKEYGDFERLRKLKDRLSDRLQRRYILKKFVDPSEVPQFLQQANLVVARSGINSVTELIFLSKPALLIPLPFAQRNEQLPRYPTVLLYRCHFPDLPPRKEFLFRLACYEYHACPDYSVNLKKTIEAVLKAPDLRAFVWKDTAVQK